MLTRASQRLTIFCAGLVLWSSAPAADHERTDTVPHGPLSLRTDVLHWSTGSLQYDALSDYGYPPQLPDLKLGNGKSNAGISVSGTIEHANSMHIQRTHMQNPGTLSRSDLGHYRPSGVGIRKNKRPIKQASHVKNASTRAQESMPEIWPLLLIGTGLVCYQLRRKSKVRTTRIASF